jgi:hypothetical protein
VTEVTDLWPGCVGLSGSVTRVTRVQPHCTLLPQVRVGAGAEEAPAHLLRQDQRSHPNKIIMGKRHEVTIGSHNISRFRTHVERQGAPSSLSPANGPTLPRTGYLGAMTTTCRLSFDDDQNIL